MKAIILAAAFAIPASAQVCVDNAKVVAPVLSEAARETYAKNLDIARANYEAKPGANSVIWLARRQGYLGQYKEAIATLTDGTKRWPDDARFLRHRGHRYITLRCFDDAIRDLQKAADLTIGKPDEIEPDGLPNAKNIPTSTLQSNIYYHLGLAQYLTGDFNRSAGSFMNSFKRATTADMKVAAAYWVYMSARRYGDAPRKSADSLLKTEIKDDLELIENHDYYKLIKLNKGLIKSEDLLKEVGGETNTLGSASLGYGLGNWHLYNGDKEKAVEIFRKIIAGNQWASFGYIAAEQEFARTAKSQK